MSGRAVACSCRSSNASRGEAEEQGDIRSSRCPSTPLPPNPLVGTHAMTHLHPYALFSDTSVTPEGGSNDTLRGVVTCLQRRQN
jgi:hypothetical protein